MAAGTELMAHIPHLLVEMSDGPTIDLEPAQTHHLAKVLRLDPGGPVSYTDGRGLAGTGALSGDHRFVERGDEWSVPTPVDITVAVAAPASKDRVRFIVEKAGEIGIRRIEWLDTTFGQGRPPSPTKARAWAVSALEQSRGAWLLELGQAMWSEVVDRELYVADSEGGEPLPDTVGPGATVVVGPEGGFAGGEVPESARRFSLGPTILRVETAVVAVGVAFGRLLAR